MYGLASVASVLMPPGYVVPGCTYYMFPYIWCPGKLHPGCMLIQFYSQLRPYMQLVEQHSNILHVGIHVCRDWMCLPLALPFPAVYSQCRAPPCLGLWSPSSLGSVGGVSRTSSLRQLPLWPPEAEIPRSMARSPYSATEGGVCSRRLCIQTLSVESRRRWSLLPNVGDEVCTQAPRMESAVEDSAAKRRVWRPRSPKVESAPNRRR